MTTDHKPLEAIFQKPIHKNPKRLERMMCSLRNYNISVQWRPGKELVIADQLSRAPVKNSPLENNDLFQELVNEINEIDNLSTLPMSKEKI